MSVADAEALEESEAQPAASEPAASEPAASEPAASLESPSSSDPDAIPVVPVGLTDAERFSLFRTWLEQGGPRYEVWAKDCIFSEVRPPFLCLEFPEGFRANHVSATVRDERLLRGVQAFFSDCTAVQVQNRDDQSQRLTHRETVEHERIEAQKALEAMVAANDDIVKIMDKFDAAIASVHSDYRSPVPPVISGEEGM